MTHDLDFKGFLRHSGGAFSGIMPLIFISPGKKVSFFAHLTFLTIVIIVIFFGGGCILIHNIILSIAADTCAQLMLLGNPLIVVPEHFLMFLIFMTNVAESCRQG